MRAYAIRDASIDKSRDLAWLLYYEREDTFHIEISDNVDEWDAPLILSSFVKRGVRALDPYWSRVWVEQRIVPRDRQNLGMILKENGLKEYDVHRLLILADGRCAQDECFIVPLKTASFPQELCRRLGEYALHDITEYYAVFIIYLSHFYSILNCIELLLWKNQVQFTRNTGK